MNLKTHRAISTALDILTRDGPIAFLKTCKNHLIHRLRPYRPDESKIAYEALEADKLKGLMLDVGAHFGSSLSLFVRSGWHVYAFEPDTANRQELAKAFECRNNLFIDNRAVSDHTQEKAVFYRSNVSNGISGLSAFHPSHRPNEEVDVITIEYFIDEQGIADRVIDFLKIDTEGFDLNVLRGIPWHRITPRLILCEFEDSKTVPLGYTFNDLTKFLLNHDYKLIISEWHPIKKYGGPHKWKRFTNYPYKIEDPEAWGNIFATREDKIYNSLRRICGLSL